MEGEQIKNIELHWNSCQKLKKSRIDYVKDYGSSKTIYGIHDEFLVLFGQIHCDEYKNYLGIWILAQSIWLDYNKIHWQVESEGKSYKKWMLQELFPHLFSTLCLYPAPYDRAKVTCVCVSILT